MGICVTSAAQYVDDGVDEKSVSLDGETDEGISFGKPRPWSNFNKRSKKSRLTSWLPEGISIVGYDPDFEFVQEDHNLSPSVLPLFIKDRILGRGASSEVAKVIRKTDSEVFAMKIMRRDDKWNPILFRQEYKLLSMLDHPNVLRYRDTYMDKENFYICTDLCNGGELFDKIKALKKFAEVEAAATIRTVISAIAHCHSKNIVHRDLKPENILFRRKEGKELIIIDFGDAKIIEEEAIYDDFVGTAFYLAPECVRNRKGWELKRSDVWTIGVITYVLLMGRPPFYGRDNQTILRRILKRKVSWNSKSGNKCKVSSCAKNFVEWLLNKEPKKRPTAEQALRHRWLKGDAGTEDLGPELLSNIQDYSEATKLKKVLARFLANEMTEEDNLALKKQFDLMDTKGNGEVDLNDLTDFIYKRGGTRIEAQEKASAILDKVDQSGDGVLRVEEWTNAQIAAKMTADENVMKKQFKRIDVENDGFITNDKLAKLLNYSLTKEFIAGMIQEIDHNNDGKITYDQFVEAMKDGSMEKALTERVAINKRTSNEFLQEIKKMCE